MSVTTILIASCCLMLPDMDHTPEGEIDLTAKVSGAELPHKWLTSYEEGRKMAARNNLPLLLHFDASWCGACQRMKSQVLNKNEVTQFLGRNVIGVRVDADRYKNLIREFGISTLPTEIVVQPDGSRGRLMVGAVGLSSYVSRMQNLRSASDAQKIAKTDAIAEKNKEQKPVRSCLIVQRDGKMVGMGGFSPVALVVGKKWKSGTDKFVATHAGVDYFLQNEEEVALFNADPTRYIPGMHGCDMVELYLENNVTAGAIEYGAFYNGKIFFFASVENRDRFESNPTWYLGAMTDAGTTNDEMFPFLKSTTVDN